MLGGTMMVRSLPTMPAMTPSDSNWYSESRATIAPSVCGSPFEAARAQVVLVTFEVHGRCSAGSADHAAQMRGRRGPQARQRIGRQGPVRPVHRERRMLVRLGARDQRLRNRPTLCAEREADLLLDR